MDWVPPLILAVIGLFAFIGTVFPRVPWGMRIVLFAVVLACFSICALLLIPGLPMWARLLMNAGVMLVMVNVAFRAGGDGNKKLGFVILAAAITGGIAGFLLLGADALPGTIELIQSFFGWMMSPFSWVASWASSLA